MTQDSRPKDQKHYPVEFGPSDARRLECACGNPDPAHADSNRPSNPKSWRCFHCGEVFTDEVTAREHFGETLYRNAACQIPVSRLRELERQITRYRLEDTDLHREIARLRSAIAQKEKPRGARKRSQTIRTACVATSAHRNSTPMAKRNES